MDVLKAGVRLVNCGSLRQCAVFVDRLDVPTQVSIGADGYIYMRSQSCLQSLSAAYGEAMAACSSCVAADTHRLAACSFPGRWTASRKT